MTENHRQTDSNKADDRPGIRRLSGRVDSSYVQYCSHILSAWFICLPCECQLFLVSHWV